MKYSGFENEKHFDRFSFYNGDCMDLLKQTPDKYYDLCIVDPPYGLGINKGGHTLAGNGNFKGGNFKVKATKYTGGEWDNEPPTKEYFNEVFRVSKNQIIWGANHFIHQMPISSSCWIVWDKDNGESFQADCELAWTSFNTAVRKFSWRWWGLLQQNMANKQKRIHPTEKPIQLYEFLIKEYSKPDFKILDTHLGSGSIAIAIDKANTLDKKNLTFVGIELDPDYFRSAVERFKNHKKQGVLF